MHEELILSASTLVEVKYSDILEIGYKIDIIEVKTMASRMRIAELIRYFSAFDAGRILYPAYVHLHSTVHTNTTTYRINLLRYNLQPTQENSE